MLTSTAVIVSLCASAFVSTSAFANRHNDTIIIKPGKPHYKRPVVIKPVPRHRSYHRSYLPAAATFAVIAGITYAIVDNNYYKQSGDTYVYVEQPPAVTNTTVVTASNNNTTVVATTNTVLPLGSIVNALPSGAQAVTVGQSVFYVSQGQWYAKLTGQNQFVVVAPQI